MKKLILPVILFLFLHSFSQGIDDDNRIWNQFIVMLQPSAQTDQLLKSFPYLQIKSCLSKRMNIWLLEQSAPDRSENVLLALKKNSSVKLAQFNHRIQQRAIVPNDYYFNAQWNMMNLGLNGSKAGADIDATDAWAVNHNNITSKGDTIVVAIIDGSFDLSHPDLNFFVNNHEIPGNDIDDDGNGYIDDYLGWNVFDTSGNINKNGGEVHSMHCAGIAGAIGNDSIGIAGVCWGVKILRVSGASQTESEVVAAYDYIFTMRRLYNNTLGAKGAFIVSTNSSFGVGNFGANPADFPIWCAMYDSMGACGILSAAAAPDSETDVDIANDVPTGCPSKYLITVTNTNATDHLYNPAGYGKVSIDIGAPGTGIYSTITFGEYGFITGTSMSSPHLAGTVASMFAAACPQMIDDYYAFPDSIALLVKQMILDGSTELSDLHNKTVSGGRLNLYHAVRKLEEYNCNRCKDTISISTKHPTCSNTCDGTAQLSVRGSGHHFFNWSDNAGSTPTRHDLCAGFYSVSITDTSGCEQVRNFSLFSPDSIIISHIYTIPVLSGNSGNIIIAANAGNDTLSYSLDGNNYQTPSPNNTITFLISTNGTYTIYVKNESGCVVQQTVGVYPNGIESILNENNWSLYPNPANTALNVSLALSQNGAIKFALLNVLGEVLLAETKEISSGGHVATIDISSFPEGIYFLQLSDGNFSSTRKLIITK